MQVLETEIHACPEDTLLGFVGKGGEKIAVTMAVADPRAMCGTPGRGLASLEVAPRYSNVKRLVAVRVRYSNGKILESVDLDEANGKGGGGMRGAGCTAKRKGI
ncbi:hypothetical protein ACVDG5_000095 [Mesorhizobium sp. ORM6]